MKLAHSMAMNTQTGRIQIDGVEFPFYTSEEGPEVDVDTGCRISRVTLTILVDGVVTLTDGDDTKVYDPEFGEVGEWARAMVRTGLLESFPSLNT